MAAPVRTAWIVTQVDFDTMENYAPVYQKTIAVALSKQDAEDRATVARATVESYRGWDGQSYPRWEIAEVPVAEYPLSVRITGLSKYRFRGPMVEVPSALGHEKEVIEVPRDTEAFLRLVAEYGRFTPWPPTHAFGVPDVWTLQFQPDYD